MCSEHSNVLSFTLRPEDGNSLVSEMTMESERAGLKKKKKIRKDLRIRKPLGLLILHVVTSRSVSLRK